MLSWKYCECGCKCYSVMVGSQQYSVFNNLRGTFYLDLGHRAGAGALGTFISFEDADREVRRLARPQFELELARLKKTAEEMGIPLI